MAILIVAFPTAAKAEGFGGLPGGWQPPTLIFPPAGSPEAPDDAEEEPFGDPALPHPGSYSTSGLHPSLGAISAQFSAARNGILTARVRVGFRHYRFRARLLPPDFAEELVLVDSTLGEITVRLESWQRLSRPGEILLALRVTDEQEAEVSLLARSRWRPAAAEITKVAGVYPGLLLRDFRVGETATAGNTSTLRNGYPARLPTLGLDSGFVRTVFSVLVRPNGVVRILFWDRELGRAVASGPLDTDAVMHLSALFARDRHHLVGPIHLQDEHTATDIHGALFLEGAEGDLTRLFSFASKLDASIPPIDRPNTRWHFNAELVLGGLGAPSSGWKESMRLTGWARARALKSNSFLVFHRDTGLAQGRVRPSSASSLRLYPAQVAVLQRWGKIYGFYRGPDQNNVIVQGSLEFRKEQPMGGGSIISF